MLTACEIDQPHLLWDQFKNNMSEDFLNQVRLQNENIEFFSDIYNQSLSDLSCRVRDLNNTLNNCGKPEPDERMELFPEIYRETNYDTHTLGQFIIENESRLVDDQNVYYCILNSMENDKGDILY